MKKTKPMDTYETGGVRESHEGRPRPDLISVFAKERLGKWLAIGAEKYFERGWEPGQPFSRCLASLHRHLMYFQEGLTDEDHIAAVMCNAMMLIHFQEMIKLNMLSRSLDDLPIYQPSGNPEEVTDGKQTNDSMNTHKNDEFRKSGNWSSRPDLISPFAINRLGKLLAIDAEKYVKRDWETNHPLSHYLASLHWHLMEFQKGSTKEYHIAAVMRDAMIIIHIQEMINRNLLPKKFDNIPKYQPA